MTVRRRKQLSRPNTTISIEHKSALKQLTKTEINQELRRTRRHARYDNVRELHGAGMSRRGIARQLGMSIHTVRARRSR